MIEKSKPPKIEVKLPRKTPVLHESHIQQSYIKWLQLQYPTVFRMTFGMPNAGKRDFKNAPRMKREGMKAGLPDVGIFYPTKNYHGMFIEFKYRSGRLTSNQEKVIEDLISQGYRCIICRSLEEAIQETRRYLNDSTNPVKGMRH